MQKITPFLWFDGNGEEAMNFYISVFKEGKVVNVSQMDGKAFMGTFELFGQQYHFLNGGPMFKFTEALSLYVDCETQEEVDYYWDSLLAGGGEVQMCGWLKDRFGLSWQIIPSALGRLMGDPDKDKVNRVMQSMLKMKKIEIAGLQSAYNGI
jgi:predicted 3-demethylubiquinone-9 3-methyltransferase (glyoxalase superfamily)